MLLCPKRTPSLSFSPPKCPIPYLGWFTVHWRLIHCAPALGHSGSLSIFLGKFISQKFFWGDKTLFSLFIHNYQCNQYRKDFLFKITRSYKNIIFFWFIVLPHFPAEMTDNFLECVWLQKYQNIRLDNMTTESSHRTLSPAPHQNLVRVPHPVPHFCSAVPPRPAPSCSRTYSSAGLPSRTESLSHNQSRIGMNMLIDKDNTEDDILQQTFLQLWALYI